MFNYRYFLLFTLFSALGQAYCGGDVVIAFDLTANTQGYEKEIHKFTEKLVKEVFKKKEFKNSVQFEFLNDQHGEVSGQRYTTKNAAKDAWKSIQKNQPYQHYTWDNSHLHDILHFGKQTLSSENREAQFLFVITSGCKGEANNCANVPHTAATKFVGNTYLFTVGVGNEVNHDQLKTIVAEPEHHTRIDTNPSKLFKHAVNILKRVCDHESSR